MEREWKEKEKKGRERDIGEGESNLGAIWGGEWGGGMEMARGGKRMKGGEVEEGQEKQEGREGEWNLGKVCITGFRGDGRPCYLPCCRAIPDNLQSLISAGTPLLSELGVTKFNILLTALSVCFFCCFFSVFLYVYSYVFRCY